MLRPRWTQAEPRTPKVLQETVRVLCKDFLWLSVVASASPLQTLGHGPSAQLCLCSVGQESLKKKKKSGVYLSDTL